MKRREAQWEQRVPSAPSALSSLRMICLISNTQGTSSRGEDREDPTWSDVDLTDLLAIQNELNCFLHAVVSTSNSRVLITVQSSPTWIQQRRKGSTSFVMTEDLRKTKRSSPSYRKSGQTVLTLGWKQDLLYAEKQSSNGANYFMRTVKKLSTDYERSWMIKCLWITQMKIESRT